MNFHRFRLFQIDSLILTQFNFIHFNLKSLISKYKDKQKIAIYHKKHEKKFVSLMKERSNKKTKS